MLVSLVQALLRPIQLLRQDYLRQNLLLSQGLVRGFSTTHQLPLVVTLYSHQRLEDRQHQELACSHQSQLVEARAYSQARLEPIHQLIQARVLCSQLQALNSQALCSIRKRTRLTPPSRAICSLPLIRSQAIHCSVQVNQLQLHSRVVSSLMHRRLSKLVLVSPLAKHLPLLPSSILSSRLMLALR